MLYIKYQYLKDLIHHTHGGRELPPERRGMKRYKVTMFAIIDKKPEFYSVTVSCEDVATEVWLNPLFKNVYEVEEIAE